MAAGAAYSLFHRRVKELNLDTKHFTGQGHLLGKSHNFKPPLPLSKILVNGRAISSSKLRKRLIKDGILLNMCIECGIHEWNGKNLSLHLDHINGNHDDNRIENLRLLCPNCHSLTVTYCRRKSALK